MNSLLNFVSTNERIPKNIQKQNAGTYSVEFPARTGGNGNNLSSGIYFYKIIAGGYSDIKKMTLLR